MGQVRAAGEGGQFGEVFVDATVALPIMVAAVLERLEKKPAGKKTVAQITNGRDAACRVSAAEAAF